MRLSHRRGKCLMRFGVDLSTTPFGIQNLNQQTRTPNSVVKGLKFYGRSVGAEPRDWRFAMHDIHSSEWKRLEHWDDEGRWMPLEL